MKRLLTLLILFLLWNASADVFTLWPVRKGAGGKASAGNILDGMSKQLLHKEKIVVNGVPLEMEISLADTPFDILISQLKNSLGQNDFTVQGSTVRIGYPISRNRVERWLLVRGKERQTTIFHMIAPAKLPPPEGWPRELPPLPLGAEITQVTQLPGHNGIQGAFRNAQEHPHSILRHWSRYLEGEGWIAAGAEASVTRSSGGDLFIRTRKGREVIWVSVGEDGSGNCYYKKSE